MALTLAAPCLDDIDAARLAAWYLEAHPDVELAVRQADFTTGFDHWVQYGRAEGRRLRLPERDGQAPIAEVPIR